jgi:hypothetical protein
MKKALICGMLAVGMMLARCDNGSTNNDDREKLPNTDGLLAVTGLEAYNGKYILISTLTGSGPALGGFADLNKATGETTLTPISDGKADVKIYEGDDASGKIKGYSGSDTVTLMASIYASKTVYQQTATFAESDQKSVSFQNGKATAAFTFTGGGGGGGGGDGQSSVRKKTVGR